MCQVGLLPPKLSDGVKTDALNSGLGMLSREGPSTPKLGLYGPAEVHNAALLVPSCMLGLERSSCCAAALEGPPESSTGWVR